MPAGRAQALFEGEGERTHGRRDRKGAPDAPAGLQNVAVIDRGRLPHSRKW